MLTILPSDHHAHSSVVRLSRTPRPNLMHFIKSVSLYWMCINFFKPRATCRRQFSEIVNSFGCVKWIHKCFGWCNYTAELLSFLWNWLFFQRTNVIEIVVHSESFFFVYKIDTPLKLLKELWLNLVWLTHKLTVFTKNFMLLTYALKHFTHNFTYENLFVSNKSRFSVILLLT